MVLKNNRSKLISIFNEALNETNYSDINSETIELPEVVIYYLLDNIASKNELLREVKNHLDKQQLFFERLEKNLDKQQLVFERLEKKTKNIIDMRTSKLKEAFTEVNFFRGDEEDYHLKIINIDVT